MPERENMVAVRQEMLDLLRQQMEALDSPKGLTDAQLSECYARQIRVQELREQLQAALNSQAEIGSAPGVPQPAPASANTSANQYFS